MFKMNKYLYIAAVTSCLIYLIFLAFPSIYLFVFAMQQFRFWMAIYIIVPLYILFTLIILLFKRKNLLSSQNVGYIFTRNDLIKFIIVNLLSILIYLSCSLLLSYVSPILFEQDSFLYNFIGGSSYLSIIIPPVLFFIVMFSFEYHLVFKKHLENKSIFIMLYLLHYSVYIIGFLPFFRFVFEYTDNNWLYFLRINVTTATIYLLSKILILSLARIKR